MQDLKITDNATIESTVGISNTGKFSTIDIANAATLNVDSAVVANSGVIGTADDQVALHIGADATQAKEALNNTGAITGAVAVENGGTLTNTATGIISGPIIAGSGTNTGASNLLAVDNRGKVNTSGQAADIHIENGGQVKVLNWGVGVTGNRVGDGQGIKVSGDNLNARSINVEKFKFLPSLVTNPEISTSTTQYKTLPAKPYRVSPENPRKTLSSMKHSNSNTAWTVITTKAAATSHCG